MSQPDRVFVQLNQSSRSAPWAPVGYWQVEGECWEWVGARNLGYGVLWDRIAEKNQLAHRVMYERHKGPIPAGKQIDHLCRNRGCVNPDHLEAVSLATNVLRGTGITATNLRKTHCVNGHEFTPENTFVDRRRGRHCMTCQKRRSRAAYAANRESERAKDRARRARRRDIINAQRRARSAARKEAHRAA